MIHKFYDIIRVLAISLGIMVVPGYDKTESTSFNCCLKLLGFAFKTEDLSELCHQNSPYAIVYYYLSGLQLHTM